jgi:NAD(P)-dependent dehydrogenase (short-subunit alcohol dehydrogenase family)
MGDVAVVTGGAGGIGLAAAKIVGRERTVVICDISQDRLDAAVTELDKLGIAAKTVACDITDPKSVAGLVETSTALGAVTSVIHTAGVSPSMGAADLIMRVNAMGTVHINESFQRIAPEGFAIVNVASMAAHMLPRIALPTRQFKYAMQDEHTFMKKTMGARSTLRWAGWRNPVVPAQCFATLHSNGSADPRKLPSCWRSAPAIEPVTSPASTSCATGALSVR